ncbi:endonuclease-3 [Ancylobacter sp. 3268]|uniref:endonuclease III n=1 Tax=Ancylobacter sp. 3268 TaxID=2817752 RepID=UPI002858681B|nr:endonuclease III [Ancylobacter sp. 3268]MDR6955259.1 endonuclease-3 [Ancylobacter sp. 3268]
MVRDDKKSPPRKSPRKLAQKAAAKPASPSVSSAAGRKRAAAPVDVAPATPEAGKRRRAVANAAAALAGRDITPWTPAEVAQAFSRFEAADPEPKGELDYVDPFTLLVAVVLSAQATDVGVNKATRTLFAAAPTPQAMMALGEEGVAAHIRTLGLYRGKARNVVALSRRLVEEFGGAVPADRAILETLPGVGRKTANVVLNIAFGLPTIAVDTHLFRVANRTGLSAGRNPLEVELGLERVIPGRFKLHAHHWLILHGRYVCKARVPECWRCLIADLCRWPSKTPAPATAPAPTASPAA